MQSKARTTGYSIRLTLDGDEMSYRQTTVLDIYGKHEYQHTDEDTLTRQ